jgi:hypothetical protein
VAESAWMARRDRGRYAVDDLRCYGSMWSRALLPFLLAFPQAATVFCATFFKDDFARLPLLVRDATYAGFLLFGGYKYVGCISLDTISEVSVAALLTDDVRELVASAAKFVGAATVKAD